MSTDIFSEGEEARSWHEDGISAQTEYEKRRNLRDDRPSSTRHVSAHIHTKSASTPREAFRLLDVMPSYLCHTKDTTM